MEEQSNEFSFVQDQEMVFEIVCDGCPERGSLLTPEGRYISFEQMCKELRSFDGFELFLKLKG